MTRRMRVLRFLGVYVLMVLGTSAFFMGVISFGLWLGTGEWVVEWEFGWVVLFLCGACSVEGALPWLEEAH